MNLSPVAFLFIASACAQASSTALIDEIRPSSAAPGTGPLALTIYGANFSPAALVKFGGQTLTPSSVTSHSLSVLIPQTALTQAGTVNVTVSNPASAGASVTSNPFPFHVVNAVASVNLSSPAMNEQIGPSQIAAGDFNNDGRLDIAVLNGASDFDLLPGLANGQFGQKSPIEVPCTGSTPLAVADFNGDGNLDLAFACPPGQVVVMTGDGAFGFTFHTFSSGVGGAVAIATADFNGDGQPDLAVGGETGTAILLGNGAGGFSAHLLPGFSGGLSPLLVGDLNNDGIPDLAGGVIGSTPTFVVLLGNGDGTFSASPRLAPGSSVTAAGDFNNDGNLDLVLATATGLLVLKGDGHGGFSTLSTASTPIGSQYTAVGDFNGDGLLDVVTAGQGYVTFILGTPGGGFQDPISTAYSSAGGGPVLAGDFNNDGLADFAFIVPFSSVAGSFGFVDVVLQQAVSVLSVYNIIDLCAPAVCQLNVLGGSGIAAGPNIAVFPAPGGVLNIPQATGATFIPRSIDDHGDIAGVASAGGHPGFAAVFNAYAGTLLNLDSVFGWSTGVANYINDFSQVVGYSNGAPGITGLAGSDVLNYAYAYTDNRVLLGADSQGPLAYTADGGLMHFTFSNGDPTQAGNGWFNGSGQVLISFPVIGQLFTPGLPTVDLPPAPGFVVTGFNSQGQFVGMQGSVPSLYMASRGVIPISSLLAANNGWTLNSVSAINDLGQILVAGTNNGRTTSLLLSPPGSRFMARQGRDQSRAACPMLNGVPVFTRSDVPNAASSIPRRMPPEERTCPPQ